MVGGDLWVTCGTLGFLVLVHWCAVVGLGTLGGCLWDFGQLFVGFRVVVCSSFGFETIEAFCLIRCGRSWSMIRKGCSC